LLAGAPTARLLEALVFSREPLHLRELARRARVAPIQASRILERFAAARIVLRRRQGNLALFSLNDASREAKLLREIVKQTRGVVDSLRESLNEVKGVDLAFVYGSFAAESEGADSDVDLIIVGSADWAALSKIVAGVEEKFGREVNYSVYSREEFERKKKTPFLQRVLGGEKLFLAGSEEKL
jgi:predicted nucleotidyltransferase